VLDMTEVPTPAILITAAGEASVRPEDFSAAICDRTSFLVVLERRSAAIPEYRSSNRAIATKA
jgi:hypothetical protein